MEDLKEQIRRIILSSPKPIDIGTIAKQVDRHWFTVFRIVCELFFEDLEGKVPPEILKKLEIRPVKTTKSFVFVPQHNKEAEEVGSF
nr:hypothetical protein [Candidatus Freyarchaeota archaeon]